MNNLYETYGWLALNIAECEERLEKCSASERDEICEQLIDYQSALNKLEELLEEYDRQKS